MSKLRKAADIIQAIISVCLLCSGIVQFDNSNTWLELFKGLFWIVVGGWVFWNVIEGKYE